jgi:hypothetical protein
LTITQTITVSATITATATLFVSPTIDPYFFDAAEGLLYPNPAGEGNSLYMLFNLSESARVKIEFYSVDGRKVKDETDFVSAGRVRAAFSTSRLAPGLYFYRAIVDYGTKEEKGRMKRLVIVE